MRSSFWLPILLLCLLPSLTARAAPRNSRLVVTVTGFRNTTGVLRVALFADPKGFPGKWGYAFRTAVMEIKGREARVTFPDVPPGLYALSVLHDEDNDGKMQTNWLGMPREGYGASGNGPGKPQWKKANFRIKGRVRKENIRLSYH